MTTLALYVPQPHEFNAAVFALVLTWVILCAFAYKMKLSVPLAAVLMLIGCGFTLWSEISQAMHEDLGRYGDMARERSRSDYSDSFFAVTAYMHVGHGKLLGCAGMLAALFLQLCCTGVWHRIKPYSAQTYEIEKLSDNAGIDANLRNE